mgnify:CR=1 FL=1
MNKQNQRSAGGAISALNNIRKNLLRLYRKQTWRISDLALLPIVLVYDELVLRLFSGAGFFRSLLYPILFALAAGMLLGAAIAFLKPKLARPVSMVLLYAAAFFFTVECLVRYSYQVYMTVGAITQGAGGVTTGFSRDLLRAIFSGLPRIILFFLPPVLYTVTGKRRVPARRYQRPFLAILLVFAVLLQSVTALGASHGKYGDRYKGKFDFDQATLTFGLLTSARLSGKYAIFGGGTSNLVLEAPSPSPSAAPSPSLQPDQPSPSPVVYGENKMDIDFDALNEATYNDTLLSMNAYVQAQTPSKQNAYTGLFRGKNLILICAEAWSDSVVDQELTPTLYRLTHNGFYFSDYYQPTWGGSTSTGEFSLLFGLAPLNGIESMTDTMNNNNYFTMGSQLSRLGYYSCAYHNGLYDFYDRDLTHYNLGYDDYLGDGNGLEDLIGTDNSDTNMFEKTMDVYLDHQPFSIYYMTLSGHSTYLEESPFTQKYLSRVQEVTGDRYKPTTQYYLCYQMELENALTHMIQRLEEAGIADDTVICMTGDHYPYGLEPTGTFGNYEDYVEDLYGYSYYNSWERDHNALVIWSGCLEHEYKDMACEISSPTYSLDILPTLSNLFGVEYDSRLLIGRDVFSDAEPLVLWNNYSWVTERGKYYSYDDAYYPNEGYTDDPEYVAQMNQIVANKLSYSGSVVEWDYFGYLFG